MSRKPGWEDADLLLRIQEIAARPETRKALDWYEMNQVGIAPQPEVEFPRDAPEFEHLHRFVSLFEMIGLLVKSGILSEDLVLEFWNAWDPWRFFRLTIERERRAAGPRWAENFEWLAKRDSARRAAAARRRPAKRKRSGSS